MKLLTIIILLLNYLFSFAQLQDEMISASEELLIYSQDNFDSEIIGKIKPYEVFSIVEQGIEPSDWFYIAQGVDQFTKLKQEDYNKSKNGYINSSKAIFIDSLQEAKSNFPILHFEINAYSNQLKLDTSMSSYGLEIPIEDSYIISRFTLDWKGSKIDQNELFYNDLFNISFDEKNIASNINDRFTTYCYGDVYYIKQMCADGAGSFEITWVIQDGKIIQRLIDDF